MSFNITFKVGKSEKTATFIGAVHKGGAALKVARDSALALAVARAENGKFFDLCSIIEHTMPAAASKGFAVAFPNTTAGQNPESLAQFIVWVTKHAKEPKAGWNAKQQDVLDAINHVANVACVARHLEAAQVAVAIAGQPKAKAKAKAKVTKVTAADVVAMNDEDFAALVAARAAAKAA